MEKPVKKEENEAQPPEQVVDLDQVEFLHPPVGLRGSYASNDPACKRLQLLIGLWVRVEIEVSTGPQTSKVYTVPVTNLRALRPKVKNA